MNTFESFLKEIQDGTSRTVYASIGFEIGQYQSEIAYPVKKIFLLLQAIKKIGKEIAVVSYKEILAEISPIEKINEEELNKKIEERKKEIINALMEKTFAIRDGFIE